MKTIFQIFFLTGFLFAASNAARAGGVEYRTANAPIGFLQHPSWLFETPEHDEFLPTRHSNTDSQHDHPQQWEGQDWDPAAWGGSWTPDRAIEGFFKARIFKKIHMKDSAPHIVLGPLFYKISPLDQRRTLKLLTDQAGVFNAGHGAVFLTDWHTRDVIGTYTPKGLFLH